MKPWNRDDLAAKPFWDWEMILVQAAGQESRLTSWGPAIFHNEDQTSSEDETIWTGSGKVVSLE